MTIWFKEDWNAYEAGDIANLPAAVEAELVAAGKAIDQDSLALWNNANGVAALRHPMGGGLADVAHVKKLRSFSLFENFSPAQSKTFTDSGSAVDTSKKIFKQGYRVTHTYSGTGTGNSYVEISRSPKYVVDFKQPLVMAVYIHASNANSQLGLMLSSNFATQDNDWFIAIGNRAPGYYFIPVSEEWAIWNTETAAQPIAKLRCYCRQAAGAASDLTDVTFLGVFQGRQKPQIVIGFDDNLASVYNIAFPMMQAAGLVGSVSVMGTHLGTTYETYPTATAAMLREMQAAGWEMTIHGTAQHSTLGGEAGITADIAASKAGMIAGGLTPANFYVFPGGSIVDPASFNALAANGISWGRDTLGYKQTFVGAGLASGVTPNPYRLSGQALNYTQMANLANIRNLNQAVESGYPVIFYAHGVKSGATVDGGRNDTDIASDQLQTFVNEVAALKAAGLVDVVTSAELVSTIPVFGQSDYRLV